MDYDALSPELPAWNKAFSSLFTECLKPIAKPRNKTAALTMQLAALACHICFHAGFFTSESSYDIFLPEFKLLVEYATILLEIQDQERGAINTSTAAGSFSFEIGLIPPLFLVTLKCRDTTLRYQALDLLERYPRREGVWDSVVIAALSRWAIGLEENARGEGEVVLLEEKRVRRTAVKFDLVARRALMSCLRFDLVLGKWVNRRRVHVW